MPLVHDNAGVAVNPAMTDRWSSPDAPFPEMNPLQIEV